MTWMTDEASLWYSKAHYKLGEAYRAKGCLAQARSEYEKALRINPCHYEAYKARTPVLIPQPPKKF